MTDSDKQIIEELYRLKAAFKPYAAYCTTTTELMLLHHEEWEGNTQKMRRVRVPAGSTLRIVMLSRFGDVGLTEVLTDEQGYGIRIYPEDGQISDLRWTPNV